MTVNDKRRLILIAMLATGIVTLACSSEVEPPAKVIVVGIDAVDIEVMKHLLDDGSLPNFSRLMTQGATGRMETFMPLTKSPILWTSIATSKLPDEHGIGGFVKSEDGGRMVPYTGNARRVKAIWDILGDEGMKVAVVGWMVTWPAEKVNGYLVSDYIQYETDKKIKLDRQTYPEDLFEEIDSLRLTKSDVSDEDIAGLFPVDLPAGEPGIASWHKDYVKMIYATDETFRRVAHYLNDKGVDFLAVYFNGIDSMCHCFWDFKTKPKHPLCNVIDNYYIWMDGVLGEFMDLVDERTLLVVCSDHGFYGPRRTEDGSLYLGVYMHGQYGIISLMGKGVRKGSPIIDAEILDVTPTILYALGIPVARDMHGRVLTDGFDPEYLKGRTLSFIPTYETGDRVAGEPLESPVDDKIKDKLRAVGYIQ
ncbi:MAG: alkaline phosphatase family protein [Candidatus Eisenbacteria bacterium]